tara:strand:- start:1167 stop:1847 length:681 start_codon:yes stop_codon:yes gene_type:complete
MEIDFTTRNLVIMHYPAGAGGKFIQMALALHPQILFQDEILAKTQMKRGLDGKKSFDIAMWTFNKKIKTGRHVELGCQRLAGFNSNHLRDDMNADEKMCNDTWRKLTNQEEFIYFMTEHGNGNQYRKYANRKVIKLKNFEWIIQARRGRQEDTGFDATLTESPTSIHFDMETLRSRNKFESEIIKTLAFVGVRDIDQEAEYSEYLDKLRMTFLNTFEIGFEPGEKL